jgi:hypothetical protein
MDPSSRFCVQTSFEAHPASCPVGTRGSFHGCKAHPEHDADHLPPFSAEFKNSENHNPLIVNSLPYIASFYWTVIIFTLQHRERIAVVS